MAASFLRLAVGVFLLPTVMTAACSDTRTPSPAAPSPPTDSLQPQTPAPAPVGAMALPIGEVVHGLVRASDPHCDADIMSDAPDPCVWFAVTAPQDELLQVRVTWPTARTWLALWLAGRSHEAGNSNTSLVTTIQAPAGRAWGFAVALHDNPNGDSQTFDVVVTPVQR